MYEYAMMPGGEILKYIAVRCDHLCKIISLYLVLSTRTEYSQQASIIRTGMIELNGHTSYVKDFSRTLKNIFVTMMICKL